MFLLLSSISTWHIRALYPVSIYRLCIVNLQEGIVNRFNSASLPALPAASGEPLQGRLWTDFGSILSRNRERLCFSGGKQMFVQSCGMLCSASLPGTLGNTAFSACSVNYSDNVNYRHRICLRYVLESVQFDAPWRWCRSQQRLCVRGSGFLICETDSF